MTRKVSPTLSDDGLLVGWSLEGSKREKIYGFVNQDDTPTPSQYLEPILQNGEGHLISVAPTGTGKGVSAIIPALLRYKGPLIVLDPKGENYHVTARRREELGQKVILLDPFKVAGENNKHAATFNPLDYIDPQANSFVEDIESICHILASDELQTSKEVFWPQMGYQLLVFIMLYQFLELSPDKRNLNETRKILGAGVDELMRLGKSLKDHENDDLRSLVGIVMNPAETTMGGYWALAQSMLSVMKGDLLEENMESSSFSLADLADSKPLSIYLVIPPEKLKSHSRLIKLWFSTFISVITTRTVRPKDPTLLLIDEAAQLGTMPQIEDAITLLRGYGVKVWTFWQDMSQLRKLYPDSWETILNNCAVHQFFGQATELAARDVQDVSGFGTTREIRMLDRSEMILCAGGDEPVLVQKPNYLLDESFKGLFDENPFYAKSKNKDQIGHSRRIFKRERLIDEKVKQKPKRKSKRKPFTPELTDLQRRLHTHPISKERWHELNEKQKLDHLAKLEERFWMPEFGDGSKVKVRYWEPPFYENTRLYEILLRVGKEERFGYYLDMDGEVEPLSGSNVELIQINQRLEFELNEANLIDYLTYFCSNYDSNMGRLFLVDEPEELALSEDVDEDYFDAVCAALKAPEIVDAKGAIDSEAKYVVHASVMCGTTLAHITFKVNSVGTVTLSNIREQFTDLPTINDSEIRSARLRWREQMQGSE